MSMTDNFYDPDDIKSIDEGYYVDDGLEQIISGINRKDFDQDDNILENLFEN